jgi:hypothetical protein
MAVEFISYNNNGGSQAGDVGDPDVRGGHLHQLRVAVLRAGGSAVARVPAAAADGLRLAAPAPVGVRAARGALPHHLSVPTDLTILPATRPAPAPHCVALRSQEPLPPTFIRYFYYHLISI